MSESPTDTHAIQYLDDEACGPYCAQLLLRLLGRDDASLADVMSACAYDGTSGVSMERIAGALRSWSIDCRVTSLDLAALEAVEPPAIVALRVPPRDGEPRSHVAVFVGTNGDGSFTLIDPSAGVVKLDAQRFEQEFAGVALVRGAPIVTAVSNASSVCLGVGAALLVCLWKRRLPG